MSNPQEQSKSSDDIYISREKLLGGPPARRASALLFAIENRTAYLKQQSQQIGARFRAVVNTAEESERAFLEAISQGRNVHTQITIQDLERYTAEWTSLVPVEADGIKAVIAHLMHEKYRFTYRNVPRLRTALGLDSQEVQAIYHTYYEQPLNSIYAHETSAFEEAKWAWSRLSYRLENLPPFWTAFSLTLTETVGASILALPIALAGVGPIPGLILVVVLGLVNILTIMGVVESITRSGDMRYGNVYFGGLVRDYLGKVGTFTFTLTLLAFLFLLLISYYVGVTSTLQQATGIPNTLWAVLLFIVGVYFLSRKSINATIASALIIGAINIAIIVSISLIALPHVKIERLLFTNVPFVHGTPFDVSILRLILGVILVAYFGHTSAANVAKVVLGRDPSGRALMSGNVMAQVVAILVYSLWILAVNGSIDHEIIAMTNGTALIPLSEVVGPMALGFGTIFVILGMGLGSIHYSLTLFNIINELLPRRCFQNEKHRFWIAVLPIFFMLLLIEYLLFKKQESFTGTISFVGVITIPILGGIFPILMLFTSRRKGNYLPKVVFRILGSLPLVVSVYLLFLASIFLHGAFIWSDPLQRIAALTVSVTVIGVTYLFFRHGVFSPRAVLEIFLDQSAAKPAVLNLLYAGKPWNAEITLSYGEEKLFLNTASSELPEFNKIHTIQLKLPAITAKEMEVWTHQLTKEGLSEPIFALVRVHQNGTLEEFDLAGKRGRLIFPFPAADSELEIRLVGNTHLF